MSTAGWLLLATPEWYLESLLSPFSAGFLTLVPALGTISLLIGVTLAVKARQRATLFYMVSFLLSEAYVTFAGMNRGQFRGSSQIPFWVFIGLQFALIAFLLFQVKQPRLPGAFLAVFALTYALFAAFVGGMSLEDSWL